jgi:hypothetical protein
MTRQRLVGPLAAAYALLGCFFLAERLLRQGPDAASLEAATTDQGTTRAIGRAFGQSLFALAAAPLLNRWRLGQLAAPRMAWGGIAAMVAGLTVRGRAADRTLVQHEFTAAGSAGPPLAPAATGADHATGGHYGHESGIACRSAEVRVTVATIAKAGTAVPPGGKSPCTRPSSPRRAT